MQYTPVFSRCSFDLYGFDNFLDASECATELDGLLLERRNCLALHTRLNQRIEACTNRYYRFLVFVLR